MEALFSDMSTTTLGLAILIAGVSGLVKGTVGFAMPMIMVSGMGMLMSPEWALAGLILPTLVANGMQAMRQGLRAAVQSILAMKVFLLFGLGFLMVSAQMFRVVPQNVLMLLIGVPVSFFALIQLLGVQFRLEKPSKRIEAGVGAVAGFIGGFSGIWGPPTVAYLTALNTPKDQQMRIQGVVYGMGAVALLLAHIGSGVMRAETLPFSVVLIAPAVLGMWLGGKVQDRIDLVAFRKVTLLVLLVAGLNLVRRALI
jgi:uncharacterized membrane protein YfcA